MDYRRTIITLAILLAAKVGAQPLTPSELYFGYNTNAGAAPIPPCIPPVAFDMTVVTQTNTIVPIRLAGSGGTFAITQNPTIGVIAFFNPSTGTLLYRDAVTGNTNDSFQYSVTAIGSGLNCTTNATVYLTITGNTNPCVGQNPGIGVYTNLWIVPTLGRSLVCATWTNSSCVSTTECIVPTSGETVFTLDFNSACSNIVCIKGLPIYHKLLDDSCQHIWL